MEWLTENLNMWIGGGTSAIVLWVLKSIPNEKIYNAVTKKQSLNDMIYEMIEESKNGTKSKR